MKCCDAKFFAPGSDVLSGQHGSIRGGLVAIGLNLHATGNTAQCLAATGVTQNVSLRTKCLDTVLEGSSQGGPLMLGTDAAFECRRT